MSITVRWRKYDPKQTDETKKTVKEVKIDANLDILIGKEINDVWHYLKNELQIPENDVITRHDINDAIVGGGYRLKDGDKLTLETTYIEKVYHT